MSRLNLGLVLGAALLTANTSFGICIENCHPEPPACPDGYAESCTTSHDVKHCVCEPIEEDVFNPLDPHHFLPSNHLPQASQPLAGQEFCVYQGHIFRLS